MSSYDNQADRKAQLGKLVEELSNSIQMEDSQKISLLVEGVVRIAVEYLSNPDSDLRVESGMWEHSLYSLVLNLVNSVGEIQGISPDEMEPVRSVIEEFFKSRKIREEISEETRLLRRLIRLQRKEEWSKVPHEISPTIIDELGEMGIVEVTEDGMNIRISPLIAPNLRELFPE